MDDNKYRSWKIAFKWIGLVGVIVSGLWAVHKYSEDKAKEQNSFVFQHQASLYWDVSRVAASLAASRDEKTRKEAEERFLQLFYGELAGVEDRRVELATIAFDKCWESNGKTCEREGENQYGQKIDLGKLRAKAQPTIEYLALEIGACTRSALVETRKVEFGKMEPVFATCPYD
jgi:hypothetical protein